MAEALRIPTVPLKLHLFENNGCLLIGPVVGIFTAGFTPAKNAPLGNRSLYFSKLLSFYKLTGVFPIVFGVRDINWKNGLVSGYFYHREQWIRLNVPLPNVIYNRLPNRAVENLPIIQELKEKLSSEYVIPWFNPGFFNKIEIYKKLEKAEQIIKYLPETKPFHDGTELGEMLKRHGFLFIKPNEGSLGTGIYSVRQKKIFSSIFVIKTAKTA